jgi:hypothetical protein
MKQGVLTCFDGTIYTGAIQDSVMHGEGTALYPEHHASERAQAQGLWQSGRFSKGVIILNDGVRYEGRVDEHGSSHGDNCTITWPEIKHLYSIVQYFCGSFADGFPVQGRLMYLSKCFYDGPVDSEFRPVGSGLLTWNNHAKYKVFIGKFEAGRPLEGQLIYTDDSVFVGKIGLKIGESAEPDNGDPPDLSAAQIYRLQGYFTAASGEVFDGEFANDHRAQGIWKSSIGSYEGKFDAQGRPHDPSGVWSLSNGRKVSAQFEAGVAVQGRIDYNGNGAVIPHELCYVGKLDANLKRHGQGVLEWTRFAFARKAGDTLSQKPQPLLSFEGSFQQDFMHGRGVLRLQNGDILEGEFLEDLPHYGQKTYVNGSTFTGHFDEQFRADGVGRMTWPSGQSFQGDFSADVPTRGELTYSGGVVNRGVFAVITTEGKECVTKVVAPPADSYLARYGPLVETIRLATLLILLRYGSGAGLLRLCDGTEVPTGDTPGSLSCLLQQHVCSRAALVDAHSAALATKLGALGVWPAVPQALGQKLETGLASCVSRVLRLGVANVWAAAARSRQDTAQATLGLVEQVSAVLADDFEHDKRLSARFGKDWTLQPSEQACADFREELRQLQTRRAMEAECFAQVTAQWERSEPLLRVLMTGKDVEAFETQLRLEEENLAAATRVKTLVAAVHERLAEQQTAVNSLRAFVASPAVDIVPRLCNAPSTAASLAELQAEVWAEVHALSDPLAKAAEALLAFEAHVAEALAELKQDTTIREKKAEIEAELRAAVEVFGCLHETLLKISGRDAAETTTCLPSLQHRSEKFKQARKQARTELYAELLIGEIHLVLLSGAWVGPAGSGADASVGECVRARIAEARAHQLMMPPPTLKKANKQFPFDIDRLYSGHNTTALGLALKCDRPDAVGLLIEAGAEVLTLRMGGQTPLCVALITHKDPSTACMELVKGRADPNAVADQNTHLTHLQLMAMADRPAVMRLLIDLKADIKVENKAADGRTALHCACASQPPATGSIRCLVRLGAMVNVPDAEKNSPLHLCTTFTAACLLVEYGAGLDQRNSSGLRAADGALASVMAGKARKDAEAKLRALAKAYLSKPAVAIRSEVSKENWIDDELYQNCLSCGSEFSRLNRRHHCR